MSTATANRKPAAPPKLNGQTGDLATTIKEVTKPNPPVKPIDPAKGDLAGDVKQKSTGVASAETIAKAKAANLPPCCCGCGESVLSTSKQFRMGHDSTLKSRLLKVQKGELPIDKLGITRIMADRVLARGGRTAEEFGDILGNVN